MVLRARHGRNAAVPRFVSAAAVVALALSATACGDDGGAPDGGPPLPVWARVPDLPEPLAGNAAAGIASEGGCMIYAALGVGASLTAEGLSQRAYRWRQGDAGWSQLPDVPGPGRTGASAVSLREDLYVLGGRSADAGGAWTSHGGLQVFDLGTGRWSERAPMPVPVSGAAAVAWRDRWIVVVGGQAGASAVDAVQIYDVESDAWELATSFAGGPVFGHAAALAGDDLFVFGGASASDGAAAVEGAWRGRLDPDDPQQVVWSAIEAPPGPPRYRAAAGAGAGGRIYLHGGSAEPHDLAGLALAGGEPAAPLATTLAYDPAAGAWTELDAAKPSATMDHAGLVRCGERLATVGGLVAGPAATAEVWLGRLP